MNDERIEKSRLTLRKVQKIIYDHLEEIMKADGTIQINKDELSKNKKDKLWFIHWLDCREYKHKKEK